MESGRSLAETPTYLVASVVTVLVFVCLFFERSIYRFGRWLKKTRRKALFASLEKIKEELMLLGLISLLLAQWAHSISQICVNSSLFSSRFYLCSEKDFEQHIGLKKSFPFLNESDIPPEGINALVSHQCGEGREPFVSYEGLEQLHRFLFALGITHVLYSCVAVGLAMSKIYSWRKWENLAMLATDEDVQGRERSEVNVEKEKDMDASYSKAKISGMFPFLIGHTSHPWSRNRVLIWMLCFLRQFRTSVKRSDYLALRLGFITKHSLPHSYNFHKYMVRSMEDEFHGILGISWPLWGYAIICIFINIHGLNIYFWLSFIPAVLVMLVGTKLQHVVSSLALEIMEPAGPSIVTQVKPRDDLFWFGKPEILLHLIQFIIFQNAFEMGTFIWSLWGLKERSCFMKNHVLIVIRLASGILVQFWCSNTTVPLNVIVTQMGSRYKKALVAESVRESLHSWCKRVKTRSRRDALHSHHTVRSTCSLTSTIDERDEITVVSGTLSRSSSLANSVLNQDTVTSLDQVSTVLDISDQHGNELSFRMEEYLSESLMSVTQPQLEIKNEDHGEEEEAVRNNGGEDKEGETLWELFRKT